MEIVVYKEEFIFMQESAAYIAEANYSEFVVNGVRDISEDSDQTQFERCPDAEAEMFSVYGIRDGFAECVADCATMCSANKLAIWLTALYL